MKFLVRLQCASAATRLRTKSFGHCNLSRCELVEHACGQSLWTLQLESPRIWLNTLTDTVAGYSSQSHRACTPRDHVSEIHFPATIQYVPAPLDSRPNVAVEERFVQRIWLQTRLAPVAWRRDLQLADFARWPTR